MLRRFNDSALLREWRVQSLIVVRTHLVLVLQIKDPRLGDRRQSDSFFRPSTQLEHPLEVITFRKKTDKI